MKMDLEMLAKIVEERVPTARTTCLPEVMASIGQADTKPELLLRKALWQRGMRYRKNLRVLPGKPDIVFTRARLIVFCDGDFWHGHNWALRGLSSLEEELSGYSEYWRKKILRNIERDSEVTKVLEKEGWKVIRVYESQIKDNLDECVDLIIQEYQQRLAIK